jgi:hypothetical protein
MAVLALSHVLVSAQGHLRRPRGDPRPAHSSESLFLYNPFASVTLPRIVLFGHLKLKEHMAEILGALLTSVFSKLNIVQVYFFPLFASLLWRFAREFSSAASVIFICYVGSPCPSRLSSSLESLDLPIIGTDVKSHNGAKGDP